MNEQKSRVAIVILLLVTLLCLLPLRTLQFEFNIEKLFPDGDPELAFFQQFQEQFNAKEDDEYIFIGLTNNEGIFRRDFLTKTDSLTRLVQRLPHITKVYSLTTASSIYFANNEVNARPVIHIMQPEFYPDD